MEPTLAMIFQAAIGGDCLLSVPDMTDLNAAGPSLFAKPLRTATHKAADRASRNASKVIVAAAAGSLAPSSPPRPASEPECSGPEGTYDKVMLAVQ